MDQTPKELPPSSLTEFYVSFFSLAFKVLFQDLVTLNGRFQICDREIGFTLKNGTFVRNKIFRSLDEIKSYILTYEPAVIQLGGIWPRQADYTYGRPFRDMAKEKLIDCVSEVVLDMDMNEKHHVRDGICKCKAKEVCDLCWDFYMVPALEILDYLLGEVWGFKIFFKVFSGRRGFHIWILDERVHEWTYHERLAFFNSIDQLRDLSDIQSDIRDHIWEKILRVKAKERPLIQRWYMGASDATVSYEESQSERKWKDYVFQVLFPLLDKPVTCDSTHLKKLPLMLHSSTKNLCILINNSFRPSKMSIHMSKVKQLHMKVCTEQIEKKIKGLK